jgi:hypothetical protein
MVYVRPQVLVFQDFNIRPQASVQPLNAFIFGGHAHLQRYTDADEKLASYLGVYDDTGTLIDGELKTCYTWPGRPIGAEIDDSYTKLFIDNALLQYFQDTSGTAEPIAGSPNVIKLDGKNFRANPADPDTYPRDALLLDRDVQIGDVAVLTGDDGVGGETLNLSTYVRNVLPTMTVSSIGVGAAYDDNQGAETEDFAVTPGASNSGDAVVDSADPSGYDGLADGVVSEVYTVTVVQGSTGGDPSTARLRITSASGLDNIRSYQPSSDVFGVNSSDPELAPQPMPVGTRGGTITFTASDDGVEPTTEFVVGDTWTVEFSQDYAVPAINLTGNAPGAYTGTRDTVYIVEVTTGGAYGTAKVTVSTSDGSDYGIATTVPSVAGTPFAIGTKGVVAAFDASATSTLVKGDKWLIPVTASAAGNYNRLQFGHSLPADMTDNITLTLYIRKNIEVAAEHDVIPGIYNWTQSDTEICVYAGIQAYDSSWTDSGVPVALDVVTDSRVANSNKVYVEYRAWRSDLAGSLNSISDAADLDDAVSGAIDQDNPLKYALYFALQNNNGRNVWYIAVHDPDDITAWSDALERVEDRNDIYGLVPLTRDETVIGLCVGHEQAQSNELAGRWRVLWTNLQQDRTTQVIGTDDDGNAFLATTEDDPSQSGTQHTLFVAAGQSFETDGVRAGDVVRYQYAVDAFGNESYNEYVIDEVLSQDTLRLATGTASAEAVARRFEIWRSLTTAELSQAIASKAGSYADRRVRAIWPDTINVGSTAVNGYYACAAVAALAGGVPPHQGLTQLEISGFSSVPRTTDLFSRTQLDAMAEAGVWIITQAPTGEIYTRHAVTTAGYIDINAREEMVVRNVDSISYYFMEQFAPYIGVTNVTPSMISQIEVDTIAAIEYLRSANWTTVLGGQLIDATITDLRVSPVFRDRIVLGLSLDIPYALNNLEIHLIV